MRFHSRFGSPLWIVLASLIFIGGCYKGEADRLKKQLVLVQQENDELKKKIELLSGTVKQLADLQVLNQSSEHKRDGESALPEPVKE